MNIRCVGTNCARIALLTGGLTYVMTPSVINAEEFDIIYGGLICNISDYDEVFNVACENPCTGSPITVITSTTYTANENIYDYDENAGPKCNGEDCIVGGAIAESCKGST